MSPLNYCLKYIFQDTQLSSTNDYLKNEPVHEILVHITYAQTHLSI